MERDSKITRSAQRTTANPHALDLRPERAFVLHLDVHARPPRRVAGRVEHVTSGRVAHVTSLRELLGFLEEVLRDEAVARGNDRTRKFERPKER